VAAGTLQVTTDAAVQVLPVSLGGTGQADPSLSGGGCMIGSGSSVLDPTLWLMLLLAAAALLRRASRNAGVANDDEAAPSHEQDQEESAK
jgi:hypothetical protein